MAYDVISFAQQTLAQLKALAAQHKPVRTFTIREANVATVVANGLTGNQAIPTSALAGSVSTADGAGYLEQVAIATYNFGTQGGAIGTIDSGIALPADAFITSVTYEVKTAPTSSGSNGTLQIDAGTTALLGTALTANGSAANGTQSGSPLPLLSASAADLKFVIATSALTAGVVRFLVKYVVVAN